MTAPPGARGDGRYVAAYLGAHLAFIPLFALLLPRRVAAIAPDDPFTLLSALLLVGGVTASLANIAAGRWSDHWARRHGNRRAPIGWGLVALVVAEAGFAAAVSAPALFAAMVAFQVALNLMFAPLAALLADHVVDDRKGRVAGWLNATLPLASGGTALAAWLFPLDGAGGFLAIAALSALAVLPLLFAWPFGRLAVPGARAAEPVAARSATSAAALADYRLIWCARLLVQLGAAFLISYFFLYLVARGTVADATRSAGQLAVMATLLSFASAIAAGYWSDRIGRRRPPMMVAALACAGGLFLLAMEGGWPLTVAAFALFHVGLTAFLSVDSAMVTQLLSGSPRRGELLGVMNLTNTLPAILVPAIALLSSRGAARIDWPLAFAVAGGLALAAGALLLRVRTVR